MYFYTDLDTIEIKHSQPDAKVGEAKNALRRYDYHIEAIDKALTHCEAIETDCLHTAFSFRDLRLAMYYLEKHKQELVQERNCKIASGTHAPIDNIPF